MILGKCEVVFCAKQPQALRGLSKVFRGIDMYVRFITSVHQSFDEPLNAV